MTSKKDLSERDICTKYITPALEQAGWDILTQVRGLFKELCHYDNVNTITGVMT